MAIQTPRKFILNVPERTFTQCAPERHFRQLVPVREFTQEIPDVRWGEMTMLNRLVFDGGFPAQHWTSWGQENVTPFLDNATKMEDLL